MMSAAKRLFYEVLPYCIQRPVWKLTRQGVYKQWQKERYTSGGSSSQHPFDQHRCIFIHIPKTGGISVATGLFGHDPDPRGHNTAGALKMIFGTRHFNDYFKFAFVRNPWDRLVSAFTFLKSGGISQADRKWSDKNLSGYNDFKSFVTGWLNRDNIHKEIHLLPQYDFLCIKHLQPVVDFVGRFESFAQDFKKLGERLGLDGELPHLNKSRRNDYRAYYDDETARIVAEVYREDIELLDYTFD